MHIIYATSKKQNFLTLSCHNFVLSEISPWNFQCLLIKRSSFIKQKISKIWGPSFLAYFQNWVHCVLTMHEMVESVVCLYSPYYVRSFKEFPFWMHTRMLEIFECLQLKGFSKEMDADASVISRPGTYTIRHHRLTTKKRPRKTSHFVCDSYLA